MEILLGGLFVALLAAALLLLVIYASARSPERPSVSSETGKPGLGQNGSSGGPGPAYDYSAYRPEEGERSHWNPYVSRHRGHEGEEIGYRAGLRTGKEHGTRWDPYAKDQSIEQRIRAARHGPAQRAVRDDYYTLLGISYDATEKEIVQAYRMHAARIHPDKFFDDPKRRHLAQEKLKELNQAMQVLRDPARRRRYDASLGYPLNREGTN